MAYDNKWDVLQRWTCAKCVLPLSPAKLMCFMVKIGKYSDNISTPPNPKPAGSMPFCRKLTNHMVMCCTSLIYGREAVYGDEQAWCYSRLGNTDPKVSVCHWSIWKRWSFHDKTNVETSAVWDHSVVKHVLLQVRSCSRNLVSGNRRSQVSGRPSQWLK